MASLMQFIIDQQERIVIKSSEILKDQRKITKIYFFAVLAKNSIKM